MKIKIIIAVIATVGTLGLIGCKPRETTLSGQIFIVTRGSENIKLGLVEVQLIEKQSVSEFLQKKQATIDSEIASRQRDYDLARENLTKTNRSAEFMSVDETNYLAMNNSRKNLEIILNGGKEFVSIYRRNGLDQEATDQEKKLDETVSEIRVLCARIISVENAVVEAKARLEKTPTAEIYFENFSADSFQKSLTDADGKFSLSYPRNKTYTMFAKAERLVGNTKEKYYWLLNAPSNVEKAQILLSNNNLVFIDPDGYFKIRPKPEAQPQPTP